MKALNQLTGRFTESVIRMMTRICNPYHGINLAQGFPDWDVPEPIKEAAIKAIRDGVNQYAVTWGAPGLRQAIADKVRAYNRIPCDPDAQVTVTCGATEAMIATLKALINPGDEVVIFAPFYENYGPDALLSGATPRYVTLRSPDWSFDPAELRAAFGPRTKAVVINTPHNPTGKVFTLAELTQIAELCQEFRCYCVSDEIYEHILYDGARHISPASLPGMEGLGLTINSVSKTYSATGWRVGWVITPPEVTGAVRKVHDFLTVGAPAPLQEAAAMALTLGQDYYAGLAATYQRARDQLFAALDQAGLRPHRPAGAYYIMTEVEHLLERLGCADDMELAVRLIELTGVASVPGGSFHADPALGRHQLRFCFCKRPETLARAAEGLAKLT
jgi:aminotransferase